jgi:proline dehydrogenase
MSRRYPHPGRCTHRRTTVSDVSARTRSELRRLLDRPLVRRMLAGPQLARPAIGDALRVAAELVAVGRPVALEHTPGPDDDVAGELAELVGRVHAAGLGPSCELILPVDRLGPAAVRALAATAAEAGLSVVLAGPPAAVGAVHPDLPGSRVVVPAGEPDAEARCRALADGRVRLTAGRGAAADLSFVRCLNVLMAGSGHPSVAATDPRLIAITGERAAWNGRAPDSWEHLMPYGVRTDEQQRLAAAGDAVRVAVVSGGGAALLAARPLAGRS